MLTFKHRTWSAPCSAWPAFWQSLLSRGRLPSRADPHLTDTAPRPVIAMLRLRYEWPDMGKARQDDLKVHASANTHNGEAHSPGLPSGHLVCVPSIADRRTLTGRWQPSTGTESARVPWLLRGTASTQKWNRKTCQEKSVLFWTAIAYRTKNLELSTDWNVAYLSASEWMGISGRPSERSSWRINRWKAFVAIPAGSIQFSFFLISQNL